jgi:hypothetical protein
MEALLLLCATLDHAAVDHATHAVDPGAIDPGSLVRRGAVA